jgi:hypothetical protein
VGQPVVETRGTAGTPEAGRRYANRSGGARRCPAGLRRVPTSGALWRLTQLSDRSQQFWWPIGIGVCAHLAALVLALSVASATRQGLGELVSDWDSRWYLLAASGYPHHLLGGQGNAAQSALGFFPLLPLLIRAVHLVFGPSYLASGVIVTCTTSLTATFAVWRALLDRVGRDGAIRGTTLVFFSPGAFVLAMVYSEGLLITAVAACLVALHRQKWLAAGLAAAAASATDPLGIAAIAPCAVVAWNAHRRANNLRPLLAPLLAPAGAVGFFVFLWAWVGTPFAWLITQRRGWQGGPAFGGFPKAFSYVVQHGFVNVNDTVKTLSAFAIGALLVVFLRCRPDRAALAYVMATLLLAAASPIVSWTPRVALRAFPLLGLVGAKTPRRLLPLVVGTSALLMAALAASSWGLGSVPYTP